MASAQLIGLISDTHGLLRHEAVAALQDCDRILHAGDIGSMDVIDRLRSIAPVIAIRGNVDRGPWADEFPAAADVQFAGVRIHMLHDLKRLTFDPAAEGIRVVVAGHSHQPRVAERDSVLFVNPGSAGPRRFKLPVCLAHLHVGETLSVRHVNLLEAGPSGIGTGRGQMR